MGQNLSSTKVVDTSKDLIAPGDRFSEMLLGILWLGSFYGIGMIWCAVALLARWSGPNGERGFNIFSILAAFLLSTGWPAIMIYLMASEK
jgi:hypothetical protein